MYTLDYGDNTLHRVVSHLACKALNLAFFLQIYSVPWCFGYILNIQQAWGMVVGEKFGKKPMSVTTQSWDSSKLMVEAYLNKVKSN